MSATLRKQPAKAEELPPGWPGWRQSLLSLDALRRHLVWLAAAIATGFGALLFHYLEKWGLEFRLQVIAISPYYQAALLPIALIVICQLRDRAFPGTDGTGIPQTIAALKIPDGPQRSLVLSPRIAFGKALLLGIGLFTGPTIGREGPSVHVGACFMYLSTRFARFPRHFVERGFLLAGGAAGISAAFNTPIAGMVFACEEIGRSFEKENAGTIVRTAVVACIVCLLWLGDYLFYGNVEVSLREPREWVIAAVIGVIGGLLGGCFAQSLVSLFGRVGALYRRQPILVAGTIGVALGLLGLLSGGLSYGSAFVHAQAILMENREFPPWLFAAISGGSFITLLSGIPGGLFDPSLATGAALGQLAHPLIPFMDRQAVVLLFMVAYFSGVVQSPITSFVILVEMTGARFLTLPLALAAILAYEMSHLVCRTSLYEALAENFLRAMGRGRG